MAPLRIVVAEGTPQDFVFNTVTQVSNGLQKTFEALSPKTETGLPTADAAVITFSQTRLISGPITKVEDLSAHPIIRYHTNYASISIEVIFCNFTKMEEVIAGLVGTPNVQVSVGEIDWRLTESTIEILSAETRKSLIRDAIRKANDYAEVVGRRAVPAEIRNYHGVTLYTVNRLEKIGQRLRYGIVQHVNDGDAMPDFTPQDVVLTGKVDVIFEAV